MSKELTELWEVRDYENLLIEPFPYAIGTMIGEETFSEVAIQFIKECPRELKVKYPVAMLRLAFVLISSNKTKEAEVLMRDILADIDSFEDEEIRNSLRGEFMFIKSLFYYPQLDKMVAAIEEADRLSGGHVEVLSADQPFVNQLTNPYCVFHITPGKAEEEGALFAKYVSLYTKLTDGGGLGADILYDAGLSYYRGDFATAKLLHYKAAYIAETKRQAFIQMGATHMIALISMHEMDNDAFSKAIEVLFDIPNSKPEIRTKLQHVLDLELTELYMEISVIDQTPEWVQKGKAPVEISEHGIPYVKFQQMRYLFYSNQHEQAIGLGEALLSGWKVYGVLVKALIGMYVGTSYLILGHHEKGLSMFKEAFPPLFKDKLYLVFTYFYETMNGILDDYLKENYPDDIEAIFKQMKQNQNGRLKYMRTYLDASNSLTQKELEVASLAAEGLQNKEISERLNISVNTVRTHLRQVFEKLEIDRRSEISKLLK